MTEYIERGVAINELTEENLVMNLDSVMDSLFNQIKRSAHRILASLPAADALPVRHGRWITVKHPLYACSECGAVFQEIGYGFNYCPSCGARMDGDEEGGIS